MKKIMLVCCAGMSTSLLVTKMQKVATEKSIEVEVFAVAEAEADKYYDDINVMLLGPQVRYLLGKMEKALIDKKVPVQVIDSMQYGMMNGEAVLMNAMDLIG